MILAAYRDSGYKIVLFIHIVTAIVAIAPAVVHPILLEFEKRRDGGDVVALGGRVAATSRIYAIAFVVSGVVGFGLISMSDSVIAWGDTWVWLSIVVWIAVNGVLHALVFPAERGLGEGDESAVKRLDTFGPVAGVLVLVLVYLMTVKPGGGGL
jgi:uncharacterized membrane protein